jgi:hypothetical protein
VQLMYTKTERIFTRKKVSSSKGPKGIILYRKNIPKKYILYSLGGCQKFDSYGIIN